MMRTSDKIRRAIAFYCSVGLYIVLLPILLSYALGYKIDYSDFRIYKTGILYLNSHPAGAAVYINGRLHGDVTPAQIEEMKPGTYRVEVRREGFYPWENELVVRPNMVTKAERIVLFPFTQEMKRVAQDMTDFFISDKNQIYYMKPTGLYRSNMDGTGMKRLTAFAGWPRDIVGRKFSSDGTKFLYFTRSSIWVADIVSPEAAANGIRRAKIEEVYKGDDRLIDVFWYPGGGYLLVLTEKDIKAVELRGGPMRSIVSLYKFNAPPSGFYYDESNDSLYFSDTKAGGSDGSRDLYRLDLKHKLFDKIIGLLIKKEPDTGYEKR